MPSPLAPGAGDGTVTAGCLDVALTVAVGVLLKSADSVRFRLTALGVEDAVPASVLGWALGDRGVTGIVGPGRAGETGMGPLLGNESLRCCCFCALNTALSFLSVTAPGGQIAIACRNTHTVSQRRPASEPHSTYLVEVLLSRLDMTNWLRRNIQRNSLSFWQLAKGICHHRPVVSSTNVRVQSPSGVFGPLEPAIGIGGGSIACAALQYRSHGCLQLIESSLHNLCRLRHCLHLARAEAAQTRTHTGVSAMHTPATRPVSTKLAVSFYASSMVDALTAYLVKY